MTLGWVCATAAVAGLVVAGIQGLDGSPDGHPQPAIMEGGVDLLVPEDSFTDIVSWADAVVVATPTSEVPVWGSTAYTDDGSGNGTVGRDVTFEVSHRIWSRDGAMVPPGELVMREMGWVVKEHTKTPFMVSGAADYVTGSEYLIPVAHFNGRWISLDNAAFEIRGDEVEPGPTQRSEVSSRLAGATVSEAATVIRAASPYPAIVARLASPLGERIAAYARRR